MKWGKGVAAVLLVCALVCGVIGRVRATTYVTMTTTAGLSNAEHYWSNVVGSDIILYVGASGTNSSYGGSMAFSGATGTSYACSTQPYANHAIDVWKFVIPASLVGEVVTLTIPASLAGLVGIGVLVAYGFRKLRSVGSK